MKTIYFFTFLLLLCLQSSAQDKLVLEKKKNSKEKFIPEGKKIKVYTDGAQAPVKGNITIIDSANILIDQDTIALHEIQKIRVKSVAAQVLGGVLTGSGGLVTAFGSWFMIELLSEGGLPAIVGMVVGLPVTTVGVITTTTGVLFIVIGKKYKRHKWDYRLEKTD